MQPNQPIEPNSTQPNNNQVPNNGGLFPPNPQQPPIQPQPVVQPQAIAYPQASQPQPTYPQQSNVTPYNTQSPQVNQPLNNGGVVQTPNKMLPLKWIPAIIFFVIIFDIIGKFSRAAEFGLMLVLGIVVWPFVSKIKSNPTETIDNQELNKAILLMAIDPIVAQAIYYYRLKKTQASKANFYNKLGWRVVIIQLIFIIIIAIPIAAIGTAKVIKTESQNVTSSSVSNEYTNKQYGFKITLPAGWIQSTPSSGQLASFSSSDGTSTIGITGGNPQGASLTSILSAGEAQEAEEYQNYQKIGQDQSETIDGNSAYLTTFSGTISGQNMTNMQLALIDSSKNMLYAVTGASPSSSWAQNQSSIQKSLLSFQP